MIPDILQIGGRGIRPVFSLQQAEWKPLATVK
jgi:hypothetical protein